VLRDKFQRPPEELQQDESYFRSISRMVSPTERLDAVQLDPTDNPILECALAAASEVVVSGDRHLFELGRFRGITIQRVSDFLAEFQARER
jgi:uncharacterized protein